MHEGFNEKVIYLFNSLFFLSFGHGLQYAEFYFGSVSKRADRKHAVHKCLANGSSIPYQRPLFWMFCPRLVSFFYRLATACFAYCEALLFNAQLKKLRVHEYLMALYVHAR